MAIDEGDSNDWKRRGDEYVKAEKYEEAIQCYQHATQLDPGNTWAWNNLGFVYSKLGRKDEARTVKEKIDEINGLEKRETAEILESWQNVTEPDKKAFSEETGKKPMSIWFIAILVTVVIIGIVILSAVIAVFVFGMPPPASTDKPVEPTPTGVKCGEWYCQDGDICCNEKCYADPGPDYQFDYQTCFIYPKGAVLCGERYCYGECCNGACCEP
jgi:tetratricopeptide (TPR) repeat protein